MAEDNRNKRRIFVTFSKEQVELIDLGVKLGMALNRADYIRNAVDQLNKEIPTYQALREKAKAKEELGEELDRQISKRNP